MSINIYINGPHAAKKLSSTLNKNNWRNWHWRFSFWL